MMFMLTILYYLPYNVAFIVFNIFLILSLDKIILRCNFKVYLLRVLILRYFDGVLKYYIYILYFQSRVIAKRL